MMTVTTLASALILMADGWHGKPIKPEEFSKRLHFEPVRLVNKEMRHVASKVVWVPKAVLNNNSPGFQFLVSEYSDQDARVLLFQLVLIPGNDLSSTFSKLLGVGFFSEMNIPKWSTRQNSIQPKGSNVSVLVIRDPDVEIDWKFGPWKE